MNGKLRETLAKRSNKELKEIVIGLAHVGELNLDLGKSMSLKDVQSGAGVVLKLRRHRFWLNGSLVYGSDTQA